MGQDVRSPRGPRCIALVGPFQSGKTTLLEAILARTGAIPRAGSVDAGTSVGDASAEARHHKMSVGLTAATTTFMGDSYTFIDCPGSVEFAHDMRAALPAVDAAVVVCEADEKKLPQLQIILRELEDLKIPRFLFLNKIDRANKRIRETLATLQPASRVPLVLRQIPIWNGELIEGFVDLALERAFVYREHKASEVIALEGGDLDREKEARFSMLEKLADHDDALMEQLLEDIQPPRDAVFDDLARELREGLICPVLLGSAIRENGVLRLMKALRHEAPGVDGDRQAPRRARAEGCARLCVQDHASAARRQAVADAAACPAISTTARRCSPPPAEPGGSPASSPSTAPMTPSAPSAEAGDTVALGKLDAIKTGDTLSSGKTAPASLVKVEPMPAGAGDLDRGSRSQGRRQARPGAAAAQRGRSLADHGAEPAHPRHRAVGAGRDASARRAGAACAIASASTSNRIRRRSAIRRPSAKPITQRGRHKKQSGGHGQFGDVVLDIKPLPRGSGFEFHEKVVGGAVPRNYIGAVEEGVVDGLARGPLGFPVIDVQVTLTDGSYHSVDSSDLAFRTAARIGLSEGLPQCQPVLLEPIYVVEIVCPNDATAKINAILSARRGQILGFDTRENWSGLGLRPRHDAGSGDRRVDRRVALGHRRRRQLHPAVRPHGRSHRPRRRPDHRRASRRGVISPRVFARPFAGRH